MATLAQDATQAEIKHNISHVQRCHFAPPKPPECHKGKHRPLPERAAVQERRDRWPGWYSWHASLAAWTRKPVHRIANDLVTADHPLPETAQRRHAQPNRAGLELAIRQLVLIAPTHLLGKMREQRRASHVLHDKRQEIAETPSIGGNRRWGRSFFDPEKVTKLLEQGGQTHRLPPRVRHALRRSMRPGDPWINRRRGWYGLTGCGRGAQNGEWSLLCGVGGLDDAAWVEKLGKTAPTLGIAGRGAASA